MASDEPGEEYSSPCAEGSEIIYAWAMDAPPLELPEGVGFKVGKDSPIKYIVLQMHYSSVAPFKGENRQALTSRCTKKDKHINIPTNCYHINLR